MTNITDRCAYCDVPIVDPTTQVIHGALVFCCPNCSEAMEQEGSGSDPHAREHREDFLCARCGCEIVDEATMEERDGLAYCCGNCARAATVASGAAG